MSGFAKETDLVATFCRWLDGRDGWTAYHETAGWDLLLVHGVTGIQIGIEAKLSLNAKVLEQTIPCGETSEHQGPDYRAVLVPMGKCQLHMEKIAHRLGLTVITLAQGVDYRGRAEIDCSIWDLPDQNCQFGNRHWYPWLPAQRETLPDYVPDVSGGDKSPVTLTLWKIKAIKLLVMLERNGFVTRKDMKALDISPTHWTARGHGCLEAGEGGYVRCERTPDLRAQHPVNYAEIEADFDQWNPYRETQEAAE